jgi:bacteriocin-like protein
MSDEQTTDAAKGDASKSSGDEMILLKVRRKDLEISDEELDKISGGRESSGYGTLDYGTMTCHGGD